MNKDNKDWSKDPVANKLQNECKELLEEVMKRTTVRIKVSPQQLLALVLLGPKQLDSLVDLITTSRLLGFEKADLDRLLQIAWDLDVHMTKDSPENIVKEVLNKLGSKT